MSVILAGSRNSYSFPYKSSSLMSQYDFCVTVIGAERVFVKEIGDFDCSKRKIFLASRGGASRPARPGAAEEFSLRGVF